MNPDIRIFTIDPALTATGWCVGRIDRETSKVKIVDASRIVPPKSGSIRVRSRHLAGTLKQVLDAHEGIISEIVVETPSGHVHNRHGGGGAHLSTYGMAVGYLLRYLEEYFGDNNLYDVKDTIWTGSRSKEKLRNIAMQHYPLLEELKDPGYDVSDAVALAVWWAQVGRSKRRGAGE